MRTVCNSVSCRSIKLRHVLHYISGAPFRTDDAGAGAAGVSVAAAANIADGHGPVHAVAVRRDVAVRAPGPGREHLQGGGVAAAVAFSQMSCDRVVNIFADALRPSAP